MVAIKNRKTKMFKPNVFVIDVKTGNRSGFQTHEEAEEIIENHERPYDLICEFAPYYKKMMCGEIKQ